MSLIDKSYFVGDIQLPNLEEIENTFNLLLDRYEWEILTKLLGYRLYDEFMFGLSQPSPDQKWIDLRDGATFIIDGLHRKWNGLANPELVSLIAYYAYYKLRDENMIVTSSIGDVSGIPENAQTINDTRKSARAWNKLVNLYSDSLDSAYNFIKANESYYEDWEFEEIHKLNEFGL